MDSGSCTLPALPGRTATDCQGPTSVTNRLSLLSSYLRSLARRPYRRSGVLGLIVCICVALVGLEGWQLRHLYDANMREAAAVTATTARSLAEQADNTLKTAD